ncbi:enoyl-CoA hydratase/isomerase family protein [Pseudomonas sp. NFX224]|uniref:enoyl-CoA hydratase/isomerase family protein n=1 Tax=Pseudomonas sp. NFX224 TaxID=3402862 RepID=UPI003AFA959A
MSEIHPCITLEISGQVAVISLNSPSTLNALSLEMVRGLSQAIKHVKADSRLRVLLIKGEGRAFCAGGDLRYFSGASTDEIRTLITLMHEAIDTLSRLPIPVIACVHGTLAGAGVSLALACDFVVAAEATTFNFAYTRVGTSPDASATWHLPRQVGLHRSLAMLMLSEAMGAEEAMQLGIVYAIHSAETLSAACVALTGRLVDAPSFALAQTKKLIRDASHRSLPEQLSAELDSFCACAQTHDFDEGIDAFFNKRSPAFTGA